MDDRLMNGNTNNTEGGLGWNSDASQGAGNWQESYQAQYGSSVDDERDPLPIGTHRSIGLSLVLSFITFGIYALYWQIVLTNEINAISGDPKATSGGLCVLFSILTFGIYFFYWQYKMGKRVDMIKGNPTGSSSAIFLALSCLGLSWINLIIMQDLENKLLQA